MANIKQISSGGDIDREKALADIFSQMPSESSVTVDLPSRGKSYTNYTGAKIEPLTYKDEYNILVARKAGNDPINSIIESCVKGVNHKELLLFDKIYLLMKVREVSYGSDYQFETVCPACSKNVEATVDISKLGINYVPDDFSDTIEVELPVSKVKVIARMKRTSDEFFMDNPDDQASLRRLVLEIKGIRDEVVIAKALAKMHIRDIKTILKAIDTENFGIESKFMFECPHCRHNSIMGIPLTANFFSVT